MSWSPPYSVVFERFNQSPNTEQPGFGCPAGVTAVIRDITVCAFGPAGQCSWDLCILSGAEVFPIVGDDHDAVLDGYYFHWTGRQILNPGDSLRTDVAAISASLAFCISGYQLNGNLIP